MWSAYFIFKKVQHAHYQKVGQNGFERERKTRSIDWEHKPNEITQLMDMEPKNDKDGKCKMQDKKKSGSQLVLGQRVGKDVWR